LYQAVIDQAVTDQAVADQAVVDQAVADCRLVLMDAYGGKLIKLSINRDFCWSILWSFCGLIGQLLHWLVNGLIDQCIDWSIKRLIDSQLIYWFNL